MYNCQYCGCEQSSLPELRDHEQFHLDFMELGGHLEQRCESCTESFMTVHLLNNHRRSKHPLTCFWCLQTFNDSNSLAEHEQSHEMEDEPSVMCFWCKAMFKDEQSLNEHETCHDIDDGPSSPKKRKRQESPVSQDETFSPVPGPSNVNQKGSGDVNIAYTIKKVSEKTFKNAVIDRHYKVQFNSDNAVQDEKLSDIHNELQTMFDELLSEVKSGLEGNDLCRIIVKHPDLTSSIVIPLQKIDELSGDKVMEYIENVLNSHENLTLQKEMAIDIGTMELPKGGGRSIPITDLFGSNNSLVRKKSIIEIANTDNLCLSRAILMGVLKTNKMNSKLWNEMTTADAGLSIEDKVLKYKACPKWYYDMLLKNQCHTDKVT